MVSLRTRKNYLLLMAVFLIAVTVMVLVLARSKNTPNSSSGSGHEVQGQPANPARVDTDRFSYSIPKKWLKLSNEVLKKYSASSGIGYIAQPVTFMVQVSNSLPANAGDLKDSTLKTINKLDGFNLLSAQDTQIDGVRGQKFTFVFGAQEKTKKELSVVVHDKQTYFLLVAAPEKDFNTYTSSFNTILSSFKFK